MTKRLRSGLIIGLLITAFFTFALWLRVFLPYDRIFTAAGIKYAGVDAYYHMYIVDNLVRNFPRLTSFLPYMIFPGGEGTGSIHFFDWLLAGIIRIASFGNPTSQLVDVIGVWYPAVLGALAAIPVYFIGSALAGRWAGIIASALIAILPGEFLGRSILGSTDHHVAESLFTAVAMLFLILAVKTAREKDLTYVHFVRRDWAVVRKPLVYSLLAGVFLGIYLLTFIGALLFVFIIFSYFVFQFLLDHVRRRQTDYLAIVSVVLFVVTMVMFMPVAPDRLSPISLWIALLVPPALNGVSRLMTQRGLKPVYYPAAIIGAGVIGLLLFYLAAPTLVRSMLEAFGVFRPTGASLTTLEMQPLFFPGGNFSFAVAWGNFTMGLFAGVAGILLLLYQVIRRGEAEKSLLLVWSLVILAATLGQRRFAYYFAVNIAVLTGYLCAWGIEQMGLEQKQVEVSRTTRPRPRTASVPRRTASSAANPIVLGFVLAIVFVVFHMPNIPPAIATAKEARFVPSDAWMESLAWLKDKTPEPLGSPDSYFKLETVGYPSLSSLMQSVPNTTGNPDFYAQFPGTYPYPDSAYGVLSWWDYGYWITRIGRRIPNANPSQDPRAIREVAAFFTSQNATRSNDIVGALKTKYVVIDNETALGKYWAVVLWAGKDQKEFFDVYYVSQDGQIRAAQLFYPTYYRSTLVRLYNFDGQAVTPQQTTVISSEDRTSNDGRPFKLITAVQQFGTYGEAEAYIASQQSGNFRIVGTNPFVSPVPLEEMTQYKRVFGSTNTISLAQGTQVPEVKIFEYVK
ncbi:MAG: oligosaccharyl transferase, archaeosortase A system-associated [Chloroflexi bacterium]|nr:oligosaccharyl transferase, archaeosortase A system-associated [Chloroflexota bacterium]